VPRHHWQYSCSLKADTIAEIHNNDFLRLAAHPDITHVTLDRTPKQCTAIDHGDDQPDQREDDLPTRLG
jgi:hypothetical protein